MINRFIAALVMVMFVNFVFSNSVFMHVHQGVDGRAVAHSHPYLPSSHHGHSSQMLELISGFNASASAVDAGSILELAAPDCAYSELFTGSLCRVAVVAHKARLVRAPPVIS